MGKKIKINQPEIFFSLVILIAGLFLIIITPTGANNDEETYTARIFEMSLGYLIPNSFLGEGRNYPVALISDSYRQDVNLWPVDVPTWIEQAKVKINWNNRDFDSLENYKTRAVYFPTLFIFQAPVMRFLGLRLDLPVVFLYYVIRLSYLLIYLILVFLAIRIIPYGKWLLGVVAVAPMSLITATSISPDPIIFGVCFLFIAWVLFLIKNSTLPISRKQLIITCAIILAVCTLKPNYIFLLLLLFALPNKGFLRKWDVAILLIVCLLGVGISLGWTYLASRVVVNQLDMATDSMSQFWSLFTEPQIFIMSISQALANNSITYLHQMIGTSGYNYWPLPITVYIFYPIAIVLAFYSEENKNTLTRRQRSFFVLIGFMNVFVVFMLFYIANTPIGSNTIIGVSGRYFTPFLPLLLLPILITKPVKKMRCFLFGLLGLISIIVIATLFMAYHVVCGGFWFSGQACKLPYYKNWGPETFISAGLFKGSALNQNIIIDCQTISHIEIWPMKNYEKDKNILLNLRTGDGDLISTNTFSTNDIITNDWYSVDIPDVVGMKGTAITIEILPSGKQDLSQFALGVFPTNEYTKGELFIKDGTTGKSSTVDNDLIFRYLCEKP